MIAAFSRKIRADFRTNKLQFLLIFSVLTLSAMLLFISFLVLTSTADPWDQTFEKTNGPHLWVISHQYDLDFTPILAAPQVIADSGVIFSLGDNPLIFGDEKQSIYLYAMDEIPPVASPLLAEGRWLDPQYPSEVVLDYSLARYFDINVGDEVTVLAADGTMNLKVVGLAVSAHWFPYNEITKDVSPSMAYISQSTLKVIQPDPDFWFSVLGLRIKEPEKSGELGNDIFQILPGKLRSIIDWQYVKENALLADKLNGMFMGLFSIMGLAAVGLIIFNTIGGQVLSQYRNIGLLKAIGLKPGQVILILLIEQLTIALLASFAGIALGLVVSPGLVNTLSENLNTIPIDVYQPGAVLLVILLVEMAVGFSTLIPAWQAGRINAVQAITLGYHRVYRKSSWLAGISSRLHLPPAAIVGLKDTFTNPLRSVLAVISLFLTVLVAMTAVGAHTTVNYLANSRMYFNATSADIKVVRNFVPTALIEQEILSAPEVADHYQEITLFGQTPGHSDQPIGVRLLQGNYQNFEFMIKEGRMISSLGEVVMGFAVLDIMGAKVGDTVEIQVEGDPLIVTIVGRYIENFNLNKVIIMGLDTYQEQTNRILEPQIFYLKLDDPGKAETLRRKWLDGSEGLINVDVITNKPIASMTQLVGLIVTLSVILMLVAGTNLMSNSLLGAQERVADYGILKTLGFTPSQIVWSVILGAVAIVLIALTAGYTLGMSLMVWFVSQVGIQIGAGPDFYIIDWSAMAALLPLLVLLAVVSSLIPAIKASKMDVVEALRYE